MLQGNAASHCSAVHAGRHAPWAPVSKIFQCDHEHVDKPEATGVETRDGHTMPSKAITIEERHNAGKLSLRLGNSQKSVSRFRSGGLHWRRHYDIA
jgi:hypothetical protein